VRELARALAGAGATFLRGGAYKPRTSPYSFRGHGRAALGWLRAAADAAAGGSAEQIVGAIDEAVAAFEPGVQRDDRAIVVLRVRG
jgi:3-deoxy-7-phosphoheptulonate synthase